jgi:hypothetical protein
VTDDDDDTPGPAVLPAYAEEDSVSLPAMLTVPLGGVEGPRVTQTTGEGSSRVPCAL